MTNRKTTRRIMIGSVPVGGGAPVSIQSMTSTDTADAAATLAQIRALQRAGCQIVRLAVPTPRAAETLREIVPDSPVPLVADIHFDADLAVKSIQAGIHGIRINPGNIGSHEKVKRVAEAAGEAGIPIRVGANAGSLPKGLVKSFEERGMTRGQVLSEALCEAASEQVRLLESFGFDKIKVSLKASSVPVTVDACRLFSSRSDHPLHLGITEAGTEWDGAMKSAIGIGTLLLEGIGDTIRVSLTADPVQEVRAAVAILEAAGLREAYPEIVSCPTCGRTNYDLISLAREIGAFVRSIREQGRALRIRKIAVMGCAVNGPGEASDAELGIAGGPPGRLQLFRNGTLTETIPAEEALERMKREITAYIIEEPSK